MPISRSASTRPEALTIQGRLAELGPYRGPSDGTLGSGTESAVRALQRAAAL